MPLSKCTTKLAQRAVLRPPKTVSPDLQLPGQHARTPAFQKMQEGLT